MRNDLGKDFPLDLTLPILFERQAVRTPLAMAVRFEDEQLSYAELNARANKIARYLRKLGTGPGDIIGIAVPRSVDMIVAVMAVLKSGAAYLPLDLDYPKSRLAFMLDDSKVGLVLCKNRLQSGFTSECRLIDIDTDNDDSRLIEAESSDNLDHTGTSNDLAYLIFTSGSTGTPKGAELTHRNAVNLIFAMQEPFPFKEGDVLLGVVSLSFDISVFDIFVPLCNGACISVASRALLADPPRLFRTIESHGITHIFSTPATFKLMLDAGLPEKKNLTVILGGEVVPVDLGARLLAKLFKVWIVYGPTETTVLCTAGPYTGGKVYLGDPIANTDIFIMSPDGQVCAAGEIGELCVAGEGVGRGYRNRPELSAERFVEPSASEVAGAPNVRFYKTGDLARYDIGGNLEFHGRKDQQVKIRGYRVEVGEIETQLRRHPAIKDAAVVPFADSSGVDSLAAYYVVDPGHTGTIDVAGLRDFLRIDLPEFMVPSAFSKVAELPLDQNKKVNRRALPALRVVEDASHPHNLPRNDTERVVARIWADALSRPSVDIFENFFELGGHSLMAVVLTMKLEEAFDIAIPLDALWTEGATVAGMATMILSIGEAAGKSRLVPIKIGTAKMPPIFVIHTVRGAVNEYQAFSSYLPAEYSVVGIRSKGVFGDTVPSADLRIYARDCIDAIRAEHPDGPYRLMGFSIGGLIAYEMTIQLRAEGHEVDFLGLIDTQSPGYVFHPDLPRMVGAKLTSARRLLQRLLPANIQPSHPSFGKTGYVGNPVEAGADTALMTTRTRALFESLLAAEAAYVATGSCDVPIDLFVAGFASQADEAAFLGWCPPQALAGVAFHPLAAPTHVDVMTPVYAKDLAAAVARALAARHPLQISASNHRADT